MNSLTSNGASVLTVGLCMLGLILVVVWTVLPILLWSQLRALRAELRQLNLTVLHIKTDTDGVSRLVEHTRLLPAVLKEGVRKWLGTKCG